MLKSQGLFVTLEGIDGCGKTTQVELLAENLLDKGISFISVREPGGTAVGEAVREILLDNHSLLNLQTELLLYMAARSELSEQVILPALRKGKVVICDRFTDSTLAYQGYGGGADLHWIEELNRKATYGLQPDLTFLFDLSPEAAAERRGGSADRMESRDKCYYDRVRCGYIELAAREPERFVTIDAVLPEEEIARIVWSRVELHIGDPGGANLAFS